MTDQLSTSPRTFGTAVLTRGNWKIDAEPHVLMRFKRVFGRVRKSAGTLLIADSDEVCRDLLWFIERFPLDVHPRARLEERAAAHRRRAERFAGLLEGSIQPEAFDLAVPARDYQRIAASLLIESEGLLIADDVGLGKTCSAICALTDPRTRPALVVSATTAEPSSTASARTTSRPTLSACSSSACPAAGRSTSRCWRMACGGGMGGAVNQ